MDMTVQCLSPDCAGKKCLTMNHNNNYDDFGEWILKSMSDTSKE